MKEIELKSLAHEFASNQYDGEVDDNAENWPELLRKAAGAIKDSAYCVGINDTEYGYQVTVVGKHPLHG